MCSVYNAKHIVYYCILIHIAPPVIIRPPEDLAVEVDRLVTIPCVSDGIPIPDVMFLMDGNEVEVDTRVTQAGQFLVITRADIGDDGLYSCMAENSAGTAESEAARLVVFRKCLASYKLTS